MTCEPQQLWGFRGGQVLERSILPVKHWGVGESKRAFESLTCHQEKSPEIVMISGFFGCRATA